MSGGTPRAVLLESLQTYLREDVQPQLSGFGAYSNRVAANLVGILQREEDLAPSVVELDRAFAGKRGLVHDEALSVTLARGLRDVDPAVQRAAESALHTLDISSAWAALDAWRAERS